MGADQLALYRRATNYIAAAMIYLQGNHMLEEPLAPEHIKPRLLGHWGTVPGINLVYAGLNRLILEHDISSVCSSPAPATARRPTSPTCGSTAASRTSSPSSRATARASAAWSATSPGRAASRATSPRSCPGTIHEGGELGYALATAFGAALDNPDLIVACIVGDGEAETGPTAGAWHSNKFLDPATSGAVLPILHVNGYKIANPTIYGTMSDEELTKLFEGFGWHPMIVAGEDLDDVAGRRARHRLRRDPRAPGRRPRRPPSRAARGGR